MRIKSDFVTNSSSLSFVISPTKPSVVAIRMLKLQMDEHKRFWRDEEGEAAEDSRFATEMNSAIEYLENEGKDLERIWFPWGVNYETFIQDLGFFSVRVDTCNNINWFDDEFLRTYTTYSDEDYIRSDSKDEFFSLSSRKFETAEELLRW